MVIIFPTEFLASPSVPLLVQMKPADSGKHMLGGWTCIV